MKLGLSGRLYYNSGTYGSPTWVLIDRVSNVKLDISKEEADVSTRDDNGWEATAGTLRKAQIEFDLLYMRTSTSHTALATSALQNSPVELLILDGASNEVGAKGYRMTCEIMNWPREENLKDAMRIPGVVAKPTYSANAPASYTVAS